MKPLELQRELEKGNIAPLYLFYGEDVFLIDRTMDQIKNLLVDPRAASFNFSLFYGGKAIPARSSARRRHCRWRASAGWWW